MVCPYPGAFWEPVKLQTGTPRLRGVLEANARSPSHVGGARRRQRETSVTLFPGLAGNPPVPAPLAQTFVLAEAAFPDQSDQSSCLPHCHPIIFAWETIFLEPSTTAGPAGGSGWTALSNSKPWQEPWDRHSEISNWASDAARNKDKN